MLEFIHSKGLVYENIKPSRISIGNENPHEIFITCFSYGELYANSFTETMQRKKVKRISGTPEYMSKDRLQMLMGVPKDDLISLGITLLDMNDAYFPWNGVVGDMILRMKIILQMWENDPIKVKFNEFKAFSHSKTFLFNFRKCAIARIIRHYFRSTSSISIVLKVMRIWIING